MNLGDYILNLRNRLNDTTQDVNGEFTDDELIKYINEALTWFSRILKEYTVMLSVEGLPPAKTLGQVFTKTGCEFPIKDSVNTLIDISDVTIQYTTTGGHNVTENLVQKHIEDINDLYLPLQPADSQGRVYAYRGQPRYFVVKTDNSAVKKVTVYPTPSQDTVSGTSHKIIAYISGYGIKKLVEDYDEIEWFGEEYNLPFLDACEYLARRSRPTVDGNGSLLNLLYKNVFDFFNEKGKVIPQQPGVV